MDIAIIGVGLIGGSLGLSIKNAYPKANIYGMDVNKEHLDKAKSLGIISEIITHKELPNADIIAIAIPVDTTEKQLPTVLDVIKPNTIVFDLGSTKEQICKAVANHPKRRNFLATHPIAGTEFSGPAAANKNLFKGKTNIICEVEKTAFKFQEPMLEMFNKMGMRIRYMDAKAHDKHIAYMSHLSHISSFMLGKTILDVEKNERDIFDMAGSGFESTVRLAKSSPKMWTPIFKQNKKNVIKTLDKYIKNLQYFKQLMSEDDFLSIYEQLKNTNHIKEVLNGITIDTHKD